MIRIAKALNHPESGVQLILVCGRNVAVTAELNPIQRHIPRQVLGFTREIAMCREIADSLIVKPAPAASARQLPSTCR